jgi:hypothetical protein
MRHELASTANEPPAGITPGLHAARHYSPLEAPLPQRRIIPHGDHEPENVEVGIQPPDL